MSQLEHIMIHNGRVIAVVTEVAGRWERMARALDFSEAEVEILGRNCKNNVELACTDLFTRWLEGNHRQPVTWQTVIECLKELDLNVVAEDLNAILVD